MKTQKLYSYLRKCIKNYNLISDGDHIAVGLSGGKDSLVLLYGLAGLRKFYPVHFELSAITVDMGLHMNLEPLQKFCDDLEVPLYIEKTQIADIVFHEDQKASPCSLCSNMRRAALVDCAVKHGVNKIALGHHRDDYLNTALLALTFEGRFYTFAPKTTYEDRDIQIIRPLLYVPEAAALHFTEENKLPVVKNKCPVDHRTKRQDMAELLAELNDRFPGFKDNLFHAVETSEIPDWVQARK